MLRLAVTDDKRQLGANSLQDQVPPLTVLPAAEAFGREWASDAHFVCYSALRPGGAEEESWPRINKAALAQIRDVGGQVVANFATLDYDTNLNVDEEELLAVGWKPGGPRPKMPWTRARLEAFVARLAVLREHLKAREIAFPSLIYTTTYGARFVHAYSEPVDCEVHEDILRGLVAEYAKAGADLGGQGLVLDPTCSDWTRFFRLPRVVRDGVRTWQQWWFRCIEGEDFLVPCSVNPVTRVGAKTGGVLEVRRLSLPRPTPEEARALVESDLGGRMRQTEAYKIARSSLKGLECHGVMFEGQPIASEGSRDVTLLSLVGQGCGYLYAHNLRECTDFFRPEHVYAFMLGAVEQLEPDAGTPDWLQSCWDKILRCWAREDAKGRVVREERAQEAEKSADKIRRMLERVRLWCKHPEMHCGDDTRALAYLNGILVACTPSQNYIMGPDGYYSPWGVRDKHIRARVREMGMDDVIALERPGEGKLVAVGAQEIIDGHGVPVRHIVCKVASEGAHLEGLDKDNPTLVLPMYRRRDDLPRRFDKRVDEWLKRFVAPGDYERLCTWISFALDFEGGPICALSLAGFPGAGKKLLVRGLLECTDPSISAEGTDLIMRFNDRMMRTPWCWIDEGLPRKAAGIMDVADVFRARVSGEVIVVEPKGEAKIEVYNPMRVIFTANNADVVQELTGHRDLSPEDQYALSQRLLHLEARPGAAAYLAEMGGLGYTRGWIGGDAGQQSDHVVASHFLWLYSQRGDPPGKRFLVEGDLHSGLVQAMRTQSGSAPDVIETIISMLESNRRDIDGLLVEGGRLLVTTAGVLRAYRADPFTARKQLDARKVGKVLRGLASHGASRRLAAGGERLRYWDLDPVLLMRHALESGMRATRLRQIIEQQYGPQHPALAEGAQ